MPWRDCLYLCLCQAVKLSNSIATKKAVIGGTLAGGVTGAIVGRSLAGGIIGTCERGGFTFTY